MKKLNILLLAGLIISLVFTTTSSLAETTTTTNTKKNNNKTTQSAAKATTTKEPISPPSCPEQLILKDGFYIGVAGGYDSYRVVDQVTGNDNKNTFFVDGDGEAFSIDPRESVNGAVGGAFMGYGKYFTDYYNTYIAIEAFGNASAAISDYELFLNSPAVNPISKDIYRSNVHVKNNFGISFLPGIKLNNASLFYLRLGLSWSKLEVREIYNDDGTRTVNSKDSNESNGFNYGLGLEATFYENWSVRGEFNHTQYSEFDTEVGTVFTPSNSQYIVGLIYHFA